MKRQRGQSGGTTLLMKRERELVSPPWNRSTDYLTKDSHIRLFHSVLLLVENDDPNKYKGYDWGKLKRAIGKSIIIQNNTKQNIISIPDTLNDNSIYFKESNNIAANFIKSLRHAFAHNYVRYVDEKDMIEICLPTYDKKSIRLRSLISFRNLKKIIKELTIQKYT